MLARMAAIAHKVRAAHKHDWRHCMSYCRECGAQAEHILGRDDFTSEEAWQAWRLTVKHLREMDDTDNAGMAAPAAD